MSVQGSADTKQATGESFAVAAGCAEAAAAAQRVMRDGGNVVDAAVAAAAVSCVAMPHMTGLGGDLFALVAMKGKPVFALNSTGAAPQGASIESYRSRGHTTVPLAGGLSAQTPGTPAGLEALASRWGTLSLDKLLRPAVTLAEEGILLRAPLAKHIAGRQAQFGRFGDWAKLFCPNGSPLPAGATLRQPELALTFRAFIEGGADALACGWVGKDIADAVQAHDGFMTQDDVMAVRAEVVQPLSLVYRGYEIFTQPPVSQGFILLRALSLLARKDPDDDHLWIEAARSLETAFSERMEFLRDDELSWSKAMQLLHSPVGDAIAAERPTAHPGGDTTALAIVDSEGNAVSVILSLYSDFGSGVVGKKSGVILNNRLSAFFLDPARTNALSPRRRSMHTLHSYVIKRGVNVLWAGGSPGADQQPQANLHVLLRLLRLENPPQYAVDAPRWAVSPGTDPGDPDRGKPCAVSYEPGVPAETIMRMRASGLEMRPASNRFVGSSKLVGRLSNGTLGAWTDDRRDGAVSSG